MSRATALGALGIVLLVPHTVEGQGEPVIFSVTGDAPYGSSEVSIFQSQIDDHNTFSPSAFIVHVGDILAGNESCNESRYITVADILKSSEVPAFIVPGDNETTDCSSPSSGWSFWEEHLSRLEESFCGTPAVERQSSQDENFAFTLDGILFVGIHLVGGSNSSSIMQRDADWIEQQFDQKASLVRGAVVFSQAGPGSGRGTFFDRFEPAAAAFAKPVLFIHGDGHSWEQSYDFDESNILRVQIERGDEPPVQVTATLDPNDMFQFERDPFTGASPITRGPCGEPPANQVPLALDDAYESDEDAVLSVASPGVLDNDSDPDGDTLSAVLVVGPSQGSVSLNLDGSFAYTPDPDFNGADSFTYAAQDGFGGSSSAAVNLTIHPVPEGPLALADDYSMSQNSLLLESAPGVMANDSGGNLIATLVSDVGSGYLSFQADGSFRYLPDQDFLGTDGFTYQVSVGGSISNVASVNIAVTAPGTGSMTILAQADAFVASTAPTTNFGFETDLVVEDDVTIHRSFLQFNVPSGVLVQDASLRLRVTNASNEGGTAHATSSNWNEASLDWDQAPALSAVSLGELGQVSVGDWVEFAVGSVVTGPGLYGFGLQTTSSNSARFSSREGADPPELVVSTQANQSPQAGGDEFMVTDGSLFVLGAPGVLANDSDADGELLQALVVQQPSSGQLKLSADGAFVYKPDPGFTGSDAFWYVTYDASFAASLAQVTLQVGSPPLRRRLSIQNQGLGYEFSYQLAAPARVSLAVYDVLGRRICLLSHGARSAGVHRGRWDGRNQRGEPVASGIYFLRFGVETERESHRIIHLR